LKDKWDEFDEKRTKFKQDALRCLGLGDYDGAFNAFTNMNNLMPPKYRIKLERFKTGLE